MTGDAINAAIGRATGTPFQLREARPISGGCIHRAECRTGVDGRRYFVKRNRLQHASNLAAEARGLAELASAKAVRVPEVIAQGSTDTEAFLVLEYIEMRPLTDSAQARLGEQLAAQHRVVSERGFGFDGDNFIGATPQGNPWIDDWITFYREHRLRPQVQLARRQGLALASAGALFEKLPTFFDGYDPAPSLLHGDLWGGNASADENGQPVLFDPACYYGDREADIAFTEMFGGFSPAFYETYNAAWPLDDGYALRKRLYNLYHELNHYNLFGGGYGHSAEQSVASLLEAR